MRTCVSWRGLAAVAAPKVMSRCQLFAFASRSESIPDEMLATIPGVTRSVREPPSLNSPSLSGDGFLHRRVSVPAGVRVRAPARPQRSIARACKREREASAPTWSRLGRGGRAVAVSICSSQLTARRRESQQAGPPLSHEVRKCQIAPSKCGGVCIMREQQDRADTYLYRGPRALSCPEMRAAARQWRLMQPAPESRARRCQMHCLSYSHGSHCLLRSCQHRWIHRGQKRKRGLA